MNPTLPTMQSASKTFVKALRRLANSTSTSFVATLLGVMSWRVALSLLLALSLSLTQGAQFLLLVPLLQLIGLDTGQGSMGWLSDLVSSTFAAVGVRPTLTGVLAALVFFTAALGLITRWQTIHNVELEEEFMSYLRRRLHREIAHSDWLTFSKIRSSDLVHTLTTELERVGDAVALFLNLVTNAVLVAIYVLLALHLTPIMTVVVFLSGALLLLAQRRRVRAARWSGEEISLATNGLYAAAIEYLAGMKTTKSYGAEERSARVFSELADEVSQTFIRTTRVYAGTAFWFGLGSMVILSAILYISIKVVDISSAGLVLLLFVFYRMMPLLGTLQQDYQEYVNELPAFAGVMELQARFHSAAEPITEQSEEIELREAVRLEDVSVSYEPGANALAIQDLNLNIRAGKTTAIVGPSGAGKSTVADLVMGLISPTDGRVLVDGRPLGPDLMRSWRSQIGYVAQETFLFNDTVRANLLWARPGASEEALWQALMLASAAGFVSELPEGLATVLGDRGVRLSGGERQRLALARALLREPSMLILDEATSAVDSENERRIQKAIEELHGRVTILVITHRLTTVRHADVVHVLEGGRFVESGDWEALFLKEGGRFRAMARAQQITADTT
jgi:ATP-binding cassette subfamily C protein